MSRDLLTEDKQHLKLFDDSVSINKNLPKWRRAEEGQPKTEAPIKPNSNENEGFSIQLNGNLNNNSFANNDVDGNIDAGTRWLPLYQTPEGLSFDEIATAGIKDLTKLIVEKKLKYVMAGYGSFGSTAYTYDYSTPFISSNNKMYGNEEYEERGRTRLRDLFSKLFGKKEKKDDENYEFDAIKFFSLVKSTSKESAFTYRDRISNYLRALHNAYDMGQTALQEELLKGLITNKYESLLFSEGYYYVIEEATIVDFIKKCEKGLSLDYIKNFAKPIPQEVVNKISKLNELEVFDNYVVLHYDPEKTGYKETEYERAKRKDPIIFGLIAGSKKLYYVTDWIDEYCDLTLEKFVDTLGITKGDLHMDGKNAEKKEKLQKKKKKSQRRRKNITRKIRNNKFRYYEV